MEFNYICFLIIFFKLFILIIYFLFLKGDFNKYLNRIFGLRVKLVIFFIFFFFGVYVLYIFLK